MKVLFISEVLPIDTFASQVVFFRHLTRLVEEGHEVHVLTDRNSFEHRSKDLPDAFTVHLLPNRKWYYPPYKPAGPLQAFRFRDYYYKHVSRIIRENAIDCLIGFVYGQYLSAFAAYVKEKSDLPLYSFFHDDTAELNFFRSHETMVRNTSAILRASEKVLIASEGFSENWGEFTSKFELLYPIPEPSRKTTGIRRDEGISVGYSGSVYNELLPCLEEMAGLLQQLKMKFYIVGNNKKADELQKRFSNVACRPMFDTAEEANGFLADHCDDCIVPYPMDISRMPWTRTCFPSKLIQFCQIGIPTLVIAPKGSALGQWCKRNNWILYAERYDAGVIAALLQKISSPEVKAQVDHFREAVFHPDVIHEQFRNVIHKQKQDVAGR